MNNQTESSLINKIIESIEIPDSAYETATNRYKDFGEWIGRDASSCYKCNPHIIPQGSFRLGTVVKPLNDEESYDLDLSCKLENNISKDTHTQEQLKILIGNEVESYRNFRKIEEQKEEKHRCWRLLYKDNLKFHLDIVPCIPEEIQQKKIIKEAVIKYGSSNLLAEIISNLAVSITDNRLKNYREINRGWLISNLEGYAKWFESRMELDSLVLEKQALYRKTATIDKLPIYQWKSPLQRCIQILKRHRDMMFEEYPEGKPISIIITTLAATAYNGESDIQEALQNILGKMRQLINPQEPRVPNPVNPAEDFADKWATPEGRSKKLEENFWQWLIQVKTDFEIITSSQRKGLIFEKVKQRFGVTLNNFIDQDDKKNQGPTIIVKSNVQKITNPINPWLN